MLQIRLLKLRVGKSSHCQGISTRCEPTDGASISLTKTTPFMGLPHVLTTWQQFFYQLSVLKVSNSRPAKGRPRPKVTILARTSMFHQILRYFAYHFVTPGKTCTYNQFIRYLAYYLVTLDETAWGLMFHQILRHFAYYFVTPDKTCAYHQFLRYLAYYLVTPDETAWRCSSTKSYVTLHTILSHLIKHDQVLRHLAYYLVTPDETAWVSMSHQILRTLHTTLSYKVV